MMKTIITPELIQFDKYGMILEPFLGFEKYPLMNEKMNNEEWSVVEVLEEDIGNQNSPIYSEGVVSCSGGRVIKEYSSYEEVLNFLQFKNNKGV